MKPAELSALVGSLAPKLGLRPRTDVSEPGWTFWELKNLNRHRVIGFLDQQRPLKDGGALGDEIRGAVGRHFKAAWWRGMAFGVVADVGSLSLGPDDLKHLVDARENSKGDLQWVVLAAGDASTAIGVHTWVEAYLSPVYRGLVGSLKAKGFNVATAVREKDGLMRVITGVADFDMAVRTLGARRKFLPEFRDSA
jgi:hypothetical protein